MLNELEGEIRPMEYPALAGTSVSVMELEPAANRVRELESKLEEKDRVFARKLESARQDALDQGKHEAGTEHAAWREQCAAQLTAAIDEFRTSVDEYLARVEHEVVRLALAVAERILHREAQMDPLLLSGAVRVALGQLAESTEVILKVPPEQKEMWTEMVRLMPTLPLRPEVRADESLQACDAVLETKLGTVNLGVRAQLGEIERGFFDLLEIRRESKSGTAARG